MPGSFRRAYEVLTDFIGRHPEIEIGESVTSIPEDVRPQFYALFNAARKAFLEESFPECLSEAGRLQQEYCRAREDAARWLSFEYGPVASRCGRYLNDPDDSLSRELFDPLFDLLKKRSSPSVFEDKARSGIEPHFTEVHRSGYEKWAVVSLANLLDVRKGYRVPVRDLQAGDHAKSSTFAPVEEVPKPVESTHFLFEQSPKAIFAVPDFILHSGRLNRFVGFRSGFKEGLYNAANPGTERGWCPISTDLLNLLELGLTLVYESDKPESIALVGDIAKICRPDLVLWCVNSRKATRQEALEKMALVDNRLRPAKGVFMIADGLWVEQQEKAESGAETTPIDGETPRIRILTAGYDSANLLPVIEALG